jgi:hypothetical protein
MREKTRADEPTIDGSLWRRSFKDHIALRAAQLRPNMTDYLEACGHILQHLRHIFTQLAQCATTLSAGICFGHVHMSFAWKMLWQRLS